MKEQHGSIYITICKIDCQCEFSACFRAPKAGALWQPEGMGGGGEGGGRGVQKGEHTYMPMADSYWWMAKPITIVQSDYPPIKKKYREPKQS